MPTQEEEEPLRRNSPILEHRTATHGYFSRDRIHPVQRVLAEECLGDGQAADGVGTKRVRSLATKGFARS
jgi:hypothetical protein